VPTGINQRDDRGNTAFHLAIHLMRLDMVRPFFQAKQKTTAASARISSIGSTHLTPLCT